VSKRPAKGPMKVVEGGRTAAEFGPAHAAELTRPKVRTIVVTSGKTGVGKSSVAANLAVALGQRGARVVLVDADLAQSHLDLLLGVHPRYDLGHVIERQRTIDEIVVPGPTGVTLVPGPASTRAITSLDDFRRETFLRSLSIVDPAADLMIIDAPWGLGRETLELCRIAHEVIVVASTEVMSLPDAYAMLKALQKADALARAPRLLLNMATTEDEAEEIASRMSVFARHFIKLDIESLGSIPYDHAVTRAEHAQEPLVLSQSQSPAAVAIRALATRMWKPAPTGPDFVEQSDLSRRLGA